MATRGAFAEEAPPQVEAPSETQAPAQSQAAPNEAPSPKPKSRNLKGKSAREKEAEGSEARDRFQADTVIKSKYQLNGDQLEVDPD